MCGIAGAVDLRGRREFSCERLLTMTGALSHRGPDDEQVHIEPGVALGVRRLSVIDVAAGRQPISNETGDVWVAYEGELYDYPELRKTLLARGHQLKTSCDTEAWVHLYEDHGDAVAEYGRGQFGVSIWDSTKQQLLLARDRTGISPLFYAVVDGWLLFASEIKAILASGMIEAAADHKGIDYFFHFYAMSNTRTCFHGIKSIPPGHDLIVRDGNFRLRQYWDLSFPDAGEERRFERIEDGVDEFEQLMRDAIRKRLVGEMPIGCYLSGGLDSTTVLGMSAQENGKPIPSFTIGLNGSGPTDETSQAEESAKLIGSSLTKLSMTGRDIVDAYPDLIRAGEGPVLDTSAACMIRLAQTARKQGNIVTLTGEGADELLAGYVWFKADRFVRAITRPPNHVIRYLLFAGLGGRGKSHLPLGAMGGMRVAQQFTTEVMSHSRNWLYSREMWEHTTDSEPIAELNFNYDMMRRWHPLNRSLYVAYKVMLPGMLLAAKGDRALRNGSTEGRFPFLDERIVDFCSQLDPRLKLRGMQDKYLLRRLAQKVLPPQIAGRKKTMFVAHWSKLFLQDDRPAWVDQLLSDESLAKSGMFDPKGVREAIHQQKAGRRASLQRFILDMGLMGTIATQLWYHTYCGGGLADLPTWSPPRLSNSNVPRTTISSAPA
jgi:asparagine synthase (glutamine-hydrolysing)